jgi:hypothetical protein
VKNINCNGSVYVLCSGGIYGLMKGKPTMAGVSCLNTRLPQTKLDAPLSMLKAPAKGSSSLSGLLGGVESSLPTQGTRHGLASACQAVN